MLRRVVCVNASKLKAFPEREVKNNTVIINPELENNNDIIFL